MLMFQKLDRFLKLTGNTYPDLVKVFLTNMWYDEENLYSQMKGIDIAINEEVWLSVTGPRNEGATMSRGNTTELGNFNNHLKLLQLLHNHHFTLYSFSFFMNTKIYFFNDYNTIKSRLLCGYYDCQSIIFPHIKEKTCLHV